MTLLPEKDLLAGTKTPKTTTGEMKNALGKVRDYLAELFGEILNHLLCPWRKEESDAA